MSADTTNSSVANDETSPVVPERVERDKPAAPVMAEEKKPTANKATPKKAASKKEPAAKPAKKAKAAPADQAPAEAPKKRGRPKGSKNKVTKDVTPVTETAPKKRGRPKGSTSGKKAAATKTESKQGRQWPVLPFALYINVQTRKPKALAIAIRKTLWKYTLRGPRNKGESAE